MSIEYQGPAIGGNQPNQGGWGTKQNSQPQNFGGNNNPSNLGY